MAYNTNRRSELPPTKEWDKIRERVFERAGFVCQGIKEDGSGQRCTGLANQCDHIKPGNDHSLANLQALCAPCHHRKTQRASAEARNANRAAILKRFDRTEQHPGML